MTEPAASPPYGYLGRTGLHPLGHLGGDPLAHRRQKSAPRRFASIIYAKFHGIRHLLFLAKRLHYRFRFLAPHRTALSTRHRCCPVLCAAHHHDAYRHAAATQRQRHGFIQFYARIEGSIGTSLSISLWQDRSAQHYGQLTEHITPYNPASTQYLDTAERLTHSHAAALGMLANTIDNQAVTLATADIFWLSGWVFLALFILVWFAKPAASPAP